MARFGCSTAGTRSSAKCSWGSGAEVTGAHPPPPSSLCLGWMLTAGSGQQAAAVPAAHTTRDRCTQGEASLHCRLGRCYSHTRVANETTHPPPLSLSLLYPPPLFFFSSLPPLPPPPPPSLKRESMQSQKVAIELRCYV